MIILWLMLFLLIVAIAFVLAFASMKNYHDIPEKSRADYSLFLIRRQKGLNLDLLQNLVDDLFSEGLIISLERLFKGRESVLVIFGPKKILQNYTHQLNLLELEDYTNLDQDKIFAWQIDLKNLGKVAVPELEKEEQFWLQLIIRSHYKMTIRAAFYSSDSAKRKQFPQTLQNLSGFIKAPIPFSSAQIFNFYKLRSRVSKETSLSPEQILLLLKV